MNATNVTPQNTHIRCPLPHHPPEIPFTQQTWSPTNEAKFIICTRNFSYRTRLQLGERCAMNVRSIWNFVWKAFHLYTNIHDAMYTWSWVGIPFSGWDAQASLIYNYKHFVTGTIQTLMSFSNFTDTFSYGN